MIKPPKNHTVWVQYPTKDGLYILTTSGNDRTKYFLYKQNNNNWDKIAQGNNPFKLEKKVFNNDEDNK